MIYIGVSACFMYPDPKRIVFGHKTLTYIETDMSRFLSRPNVMPILIPDVPEAELHQYLNFVQGFVFQGGADIAPQTYGATPIENNRWPGDRHRDQYELKIFDYAFQRKKPILGICRGMQIANVYFGGTLYQDLTLQTSTKLVHRDAETYDRVHHSVVCPEQSLLRKIYGKEKLEVNSVHHQGIQKLGNGLVVDAISDQDHVIEAFHDESENVIAVQWHPEFSHALGKTIVDPKPIYDYFLSKTERALP